MALITNLIFNGVDRTSRLEFLNLAPGALITFDYDAVSGNTAISERPAMLELFLPEFAEAISEVQIWQRETVSRLDVRVGPCPQYAITHRRAGQSLFLDGSIEGQEFKAHYLHHPSSDRRVVRLNPRDSLTLSWCGVKLFNEAHVELLARATTWG